MISTVFLCGRAEVAIVDEDSDVSSAIFISLIGGFTSLSQIFAGKVFTLLDFDAWDRRDREVADEENLFDCAVERELLEDDVVDKVAFDGGFVDGIGMVGTSVMSLAVAMKISPVVVRTAYCLSFVIGWIVDDSMCTNTPFANTISPGRRVAWAIDDVVEDDTGVISYDKSCDNVAVDGSLYTSVTLEDSVVDDVEFGVLLLLIAVPHIVGGVAFVELIRTIPPLEANIRLQNFQEL